MDTQSGAVSLQGQAPAGALEVRAQAILEQLGEASASHGRQQPPQP